MAGAGAAGGWLPQKAIECVAELLGMAKIRVLEVATFYTMFLLQPVGRKAHVQWCGTTPCLLRGGEEIKKVCEQRINHEPFHVSADGDFSWEEVECLGACVNAPMVLIGKDTYEDLTPETFEKVLDALGRGEMPKPGPQNGRQFSAPIGGDTTLTDSPLSIADERAPSAGLRGHPQPAAVRAGTGGTDPRRACTVARARHLSQPPTLRRPRRIPRRSPRPKKPKSAPSSLISARMRRRSKKRTPSAPGRRASPRPARTRATTSSASRASAV